MAYATTTELARILRLGDNLSGAQEAALQRVLDDAAVDIDAELDREEPFDFSDPEGIAALPKLAQVNLDRAQDLWMFTEAAGGVLGLGTETPILIPRNSWERHAQALAPLKKQWGLA